MEERQQMQMAMETGAIQGHQGIKYGRNLPEPQDADAKDPVQPGHGGKPAGQAKCQAALGFGPFTHRQHGERCRDQQQDNMTGHMRAKDEFAASEEGELRKSHTNQCCRQKEDS